MAAVCTQTTLASDKTPQWTVAIEFPDNAVDAIAGIGQAKQPAAPPVPLDAKLRLLKRVRLASVPPALLTPTVLALYINAESVESRSYVNGLVAQLAKHPRHTAILSRLEGTATGYADPFASSHRVRASDAAALPPWHPNRCTHALVYVSGGTHLSLHLLASHTRYAEHMAGCVQRDGSVTVDLAPEHAFIERLERQKRADTHARIQRALSAESIVSLAPPALQPGGGLRRKRQLQRRSGVITMTDVERIATPDPNEDIDLPVAEGETEEDSSHIEAVNKRLAKQLIIAALKDRGISRNHPEFAALWSQIYRSLKFSLRDNISRRKLSVRDLRAETNKHTAFYCSS
ncbi:hypothetical protein GGI23_001801 [Coemansia sp. RSA 2559]|nr:hypothetical protein GGI23_001801 [Coemansia sp. RSA 2559]